jgi:hypothetical protein
MSDPQIPGRPAGWLQWRYSRLCSLLGHEPTHDDRLAVTRCARCGVALAVDEEPDR